MEMARIRLCLGKECRRSRIINLIDDIIDLKEHGMTKEQLINIIMGLLDTDLDLNFLIQLRKDDLETLVACIRDRVGQMGR
jgi:hypothetical protein